MRPHTAGPWRRAPGRLPGRDGPTRWLDAARAYAVGDLAEAAEIYAEIGSLPDEAFARLRTAETLVSHGTRSHADAQLLRALAFYRSVAATAYVLEGEALVAASA